MNEQDRQALYALVEASLFDRPFRSPVTDWNAIYKEMCAQALAPLPTPLLSASFLDGNEALAKEWHIRASRHIVIYHKRLAQQNQLMALMRQNNIPAVILKGAAAAVYYPHPELRQMGDIDFMVLPEDFDRAHKLMEENSYTLEFPEDFMPYHMTFTKDKAEFELHRYPPGLRRGDTGEYLKSLFYDGIRHSEELHIGDYTFPAFPKMQNGLVLLLHIVKHLKDGLGLRQIIDWMMYVDRCLDDQFWETEFRPVAEAAGLSTIAKTVTKLCQRHLGLRTDGITWCMDAEDAVCDDFLAYLAAQGNFGTKVDFQEESGARIMSKVRNPIQCFRMLQKIGCERWDAVQKHPKLKYIAWLYQILIYIKTIFTRKGTLKTWSKNVVDGTERGKLFDALAIYKK